MCLLLVLAACKAFTPQLAATPRRRPCSLIFLSELGDKTFFIAALLAMRCGKWISFIGSTAALAAMTVSRRLRLQIMQPAKWQAGVTAVGR